MAEETKRGSFLLKALGAIISVAGVLWLLGWVPQPLKEIEGLPNRLYVGWSLIGLGGIIHGYGRVKKK